MTLTDKSIIPYDRERAQAYALEWALRRNPKFYDFSSIGGDCTNFASQVILAGGTVMNFEPTLGWFYQNGNNKSPSWSGVDFLYQFLTTNQKTGPVAEVISPSQSAIGDIVQISFSIEGHFNHSLIITQLSKPLRVDNIFVSAHSDDQRNVKLNEAYTWSRIRFLHIIGSRG